MAWVELEFAPFVVSGRADIGPCGKWWAAEMAELQVRGMHILKKKKKRSVECIDWTCLQVENPETESRSGRNLRFPNRWSPAMPSTSRGTRTTVLPPPLRPPSAFSYSPAVRKRRAPVLPILLDGEPSPAEAARLRSPGFHGSPSGTPLPRSAVPEQDWQNMVLFAPLGNFRWFGGYLFLLASAVCRPTRCKFCDNLTELIYCLLLDFFRDKLITQKPRLAAIAC
jgi:hypothetical protein